MSLTDDERATMVALLDYANPQGLHPDEAHWRDFARTELGLRDERIRQLERLNATLSAEIDCGRPVIEAAVNRADSLRRIHSDGLTADEIELVRTVANYEQASQPK